MILKKENTTTTKTITITTITVGARKPNSFSEGTGYFVLKGEVFPDW